MFKVLSIALISLLGINYANDSDNNIHFVNPRTANVSGGISYSDLDTGFYCIDSDYKYGPINDYYTYSYRVAFNLKADYVLFNDGYNIYETNNFDNFVLIDNDYSVDFKLTFKFYDLFELSLTYNDLEQSGIEQYYEGLDLNKYALYLVNPIITHINPIYFDDQSDIVSDLIPFYKDDRFTWVDSDFVFGNEPLTMGYFNVTDNSYFKLGFVTQTTIQQIDNVTIFDGLFKSYDTFFTEYRIGYMQMITGNNYFGDINIVNLSDAIHLTNSMYFYPMVGQYKPVSSNGYVASWYTQNVQLGYSGTVNTVITNVQNFTNNSFKTLHLYYQVNDFHNQTNVYAKSYLDLLEYNPGSSLYPSGDGGASLNGVFELLGYAFKQLWSIGNIALFGSITINTLIILPLVISLVMFIIHLIKKG